MQETKGPKRTPTPEIDPDLPVDQAMATIEVNAKRVHQTGDGRWAIQIPTKPLTNEQREILDTLFPHTHEQMGRLLEIEILLGAIVK